MQHTPAAHKARQEQRRNERRRLLARENGCIHKKRLKTKDAATASAQAQGLNAYPCTFCGGWHLTKQR